MDWLMVARSLADADHDEGLSGKLGIGGGPVISAIWGSADVDFKFEFAAKLGGGCDKSTFGRDTEGGVDVDGLETSACLDGRPRLGRTASWVPSRT